MAVGYVRSMSRNAAPAAPDVWPYIAASTATLAVGRSQRSARGDRRVHVVLARGRGQAVIAGNRGEHTRFDLAEIGAHESEPGVGTDRRAQFRGQVVQPARSSHPAGRPIGGAPLAAQPAAGFGALDAAVEPAVAIGRRDPLGLAPGQQRGDQRGRRRVRFESPGSGVGQVQPHPGKQLLDLRRAAQVDRLARGMLQDRLVADLTHPLLVRAVAWPFADAVSQQRFGRRNVEGQAVQAEFHGQQRRGGLREGGQQG